MSVELMYVKDIASTLGISTKKAYEVMSAKKFPLEPRFKGAQRLRVRRDRFDEWYENKRSKQT